MGFLKNVVTLATGTTLAQALPILVSPFLTRLYTPEDFGVLALFLSLVAVLANLATGKYDLAIVVAKTRWQAISLVKICLLILICVTLLLSIIVFFWSDQIVDLINSEQVLDYLWLIPFSVFFVGLFSILQLYNTRVVDYPRIAKATVSKSVVMVTTQVGLGALLSGPLGLVSGQVMAYLSGNSILARPLLEYRRLLIKFDRSDLLYHARIFSKFPKFTLPSTVISSLNVNAINFIISSLFSASTLGFFSFTNRMLGAPSLVIGGNVSTVYYQTAAARLAKGQPITDLFYRTLKNLAIISILIYGSIAFLAEHIFAFVFGEEWRIAGQYAQILAPFMGVRFVASSLSKTVEVCKRQEIGLVINITLLSAVLLLSFISYRQDWLFDTFLVYFSVLMALLYGIFILGYRQLVCRA